MVNLRCCLCRLRENPGDWPQTSLEPTKLPGSGYRCVDRDACRARVIDIIQAHVNLAGACNEETP